MSDTESGLVRPDFECYRGPACGTVHSPPEERPSVEDSGAMRLSHKQAVKEKDSFLELIREESVLLVSLLAAGKFVQEEM